MFRSKILIGSLVAITSLSAFALTSTTVSAEDEPYSETYTKTALIRVQSACTFSGAVSTPHTMDIPAGSYRSNIGETVFSVACNDAGGFGIYAIGYTGDTDGNNKLVNTTDSTIFINTGTATSGDNSAWAMKLTAVENDSTPTIHNGYNNYSVVPDNYVKVASYPSATSASASSIFKSSYASYITLQQTASTYQGQVKYVMVHPASEAPEPPEPGDEDPLDPNKDITEDTNHPCMNLGDGSTCDDTDDDGVGDTLVFPGNSLLRAFEIAYTTAGKPMYIEDANTDIGWRPMVASDYATVGGKEVRFAMQDVDMTLDGETTGTKVCDAAASSNTATPYVDEALVMDLRDGKSYWVAKLQDNKCWMTQNLDLDLTHGVELNSTTTDLNSYTANTDYYSDYRQDANNIVYWNPSHTTYNYAQSTGSAIEYDDYFDEYSLDPGDWYWIGTWNNNGVSTWHTSNGGGNYLTAADPSSLGFGRMKFTGNQEHGHIGNYYTWSAAVASNDTNAYDTDNLNTPSQNAPNSICPQGWRLPIAATYTDGALGANDYYNLVYSYGNYKANDSVLTAEPIWLIRGGHAYDDGAISDADFTGDYWTSTNQSTDLSNYWSGSYVIYFNPGNWSIDAMGFDGVDYRDAGRSIRCIAR